MRIFISQIQTILNCLKKTPTKRKCYEGGYCSYRTDCCRIREIVEEDQGAILAGQASHTEYRSGKEIIRPVSFPHGRVPFHPNVRARYGLNPCG